MTGLLSLLSERIGRRVIARQIAEMLGIPVKSLDHAIDADVACTRFLFGELVP